MSDEVKWLPVAVCSALMGAQIGLVVFDYWKWWRERRRPLKGYEKVERGELVNGWRVLISQTTLKQTHPFFRTGNVVRPRWPAIVNDLPTPTNVDAPSVVFWFEHDTPDGRTMFSLSRHSTLTPSINADIAQVYHHKNGWFHQFSSYVTERVIASVFQETDGTNFRILLVDVTSKSCRIVTVEPPIPDVIPVAVYQGNTRKRRLNVVFTAVSIDAPIDELDLETPPVWKRDFYEVAYEIPNADIATESAVKPSSQQSISIPVGERVFIWLRLGVRPPIIVLYERVDGDSAADVSSHRFFSFDRNGNWQLENFAEWLTRFRSTTYGSKLMNVVESFGALSPPEDWGWMELEPMRYLTRAQSGYPVSNALFFTTRGSGILRRWLYPPTLKRTAAVVFLRSNPTLKPQELESIVGFDMFDGMLDENAGKNTPLINFK